MKKNLILILMSIFLSCSKEEERIENEINSDIKVSIIENLERSGNVLKIKSETVEQQACINFELITDYRMNDNDIQIKYTEIFKPDICLTAIGPATSQHSFILSEEEVYNLSFVIEGNQNTAELIVDNDKYVLELLSSDNIILTRDTLFKVPENTFWGRIGYHEMSSEVLVGEFTDILEGQDVEFIDYPDGDYGYFLIKGDKIVPPENHGYYFLEPLIFDYSGDFNELREIILQFAETYQKNISIYIMDYQGREISIWNK